MAFILAFLLTGAGGGSLLHDFLEQRHMERAVVRVMRQIAHQPERELMREQKHEEIEGIRQKELAKAVAMLWEGSVAGSGGSSISRHPPCEVRS